MFLIVKNDNIGSLKSCLVFHCYSRIGSVNHCLVQKHDDEQQRAVRTWQSEQALFSAHESVYTLIHDATECSRVLYVSCNNIPRETSRNAQGKVQVCLHFIKA